VRAIRDLLLLRGELQTDKWALLWGTPNASMLLRVRVIALPSSPQRWKFSDGVRSFRSWLGAAALLAVVMIALLPFASRGVEVLGNLLAVRSKTSTSMSGHG
jgi:hypothetical protein